MANGDKSRRNSASFNNFGTLLGKQNEYNDTRLRTGLNVLKVDQLNEQRRDDYNFNNQLANYRTEEDIRRYDHSQGIYNLGQKAIKGEAKYQRNQVYKDTDAKLQEFGYQQDDLDFDFARESIKNNFDQANNKLALNDNRQNLRINRQDDLANQEQTKLRGQQFGTDMKDMSAKQTQEKADARRKLLKSTLETQAKAGNALASGRRGQSASLLNQSIESVAAIDHYALHTQLQRGDDSFANITQGVTNKKKSEDTQAGIQRKKFGLQRNQLQNKRKNLMNEQKEMAQLFGLTVEQYTADTEKLGRMMLDTYDSIGSQLEDIDRKVFKESVNLFAKMPLPPRTAPRALPPRELDYDKLVLPDDPIRYDHNIQGSVQQPKKKSGLAQAAGFLSIGLGVASQFVAPGNPSLAIALGGGGALLGQGAESGLF